MFNKFFRWLTEHTFSKLRANLDRMERKAEREHNMLKDAALTAMTNKCKKVIKKKEAKIKSAIGMDDMSVNDIKAELTSEVCKDFCRDGKPEPLTLADSASLYD